ncbi:hypothetical protein LAD73_02820 [Mycoplasma sp. 1331]|uniref:Uncharacterized protein n=1 Tax=Mycoplasma tauri TaxID=547987 RepID=A0A953NES6_9MOLU|nr:hypothetical protein [Mycoplasma tauri]MBZ4195633.1 hypothetical protein [Mycoplasma tauri]
MVIVYTVLYILLIKISAFIIFFVFKYKNNKKVKKENKKDYPHSDISVITGIASDYSNDKMGDTNCKLSIVNKQILNYLYPEEFIKEQKDNIWVKIYYDTIDKFVKKGAILGNYNKLKNRKHLKNFRNEVGQWNYCRHHIDEIKISGAIFKNEPTLSNYYKVEKSVLVTYEEHLLLHYLIVMSKITYPNNGMIVGLNFYFNNYAKCVEYWDKTVKKLCKEYSVPYDPEWWKNLR